MKKSSKKDIRSLNLGEIQAWFEAHGEKSFRAKQVFEWLWQKSAQGFDEMTNLSLPLRTKLKENFSLETVQVDDKQVSQDRTIKSAFKLPDGNIVEGVLIPTDNRMTACISSQVGCSLACKFCATGRLKRMRNLDPAEIYDQVVAIRNQSEEHYNIPLSNIVYMGMGEPLLNYKGLMGSVEKITSPEGLGMSPKRITVSTAGIARQIKRLADDEVRFNLALSLHAANDKKRSEIMAINDSNSLDALAEALMYFYEKTKNTITFEYIVFKDFNDTLKDAQELVEYCRRVPAKVNIIEYNPIDDGEFERADPEKVDRFAAYLEKHRIGVTIRRSRGKDIDAACGQLANKNKAVVN